MTKKRRRIELLQSQTKEVGLSKLSVSQFSALLTEGKHQEGTFSAPKIPETLLKAQQAQSAGEMEMDKAIEARFSLEIRAT